MSDTKQRPKIVCLCGSTRFKQAFIDANFRETMAGRIVLSVGWFSHADTVRTPTEAEKAALDELHLRKIDMADEVLVLDAKTATCLSCRKACFVRHCTSVRIASRSACCDAEVDNLPYFGESTRREIAYAEAQGKAVRYLSQEQTA